MKWHRVGFTFFVELALGYLPEKRYRGGHGVLRLHGPLLPRDGHVLALVAERARVQVSSYRKRLQVCWPSNVGCYILAVNLRLYETLFGVFKSA